MFLMAFLKLMLLHLVCYNQKCSRNFLACTKYTQQVVEANGSKKLLQILKSTIGIGVQHQHLFIFQSADHDQLLLRVVTEFSDIVAQYNVLPQQDTTCRGTQDVLYFGKYWPKGGKKVIDCKANSKHSKFYEALKKAALWQYLTNFLHEKYPQQWQLLQNLPKEVHIFGL